VGVHVFEIEQVLQLLGEAKKADEKDWLLILVAFLHALRSSEAVGLKPSNVIGDRLKVKRLKNSNPVNDELVKHDNPLLDERKAMIDLCLKTPGNQRLFSISARTFQRRMHTYGEAAGLPELYCHPHTLKHSILDYLRANLPLEELQDRSGHKSLDSLRIYLHPKKAVVDGKVKAALGCISV
jgi:integrase